MEQIENKRGRPCKPPGNLTYEDVELIWALREENRKLREEEAQLKARLKVIAKEKTYLTIAAIGRKFECSRDDVINSTRKKNKCQR